MMTCFLCGEDKVREIEWLQNGPSIKYACLNCGSLHTDEQWKESERRKNE